jgi:hypothetical protein
MFYFRIKTNAENATISVNGSQGKTDLKLEEPTFVSWSVSNMYGTKQNTTYISGETTLFVDFSDLQGQSGGSGKTPIPQPNASTEGLFLSNDGQSLVWREAQDLYTNDQPTTEKVGDIEAGTTFDHETMDSMWTKLLYAYVPPVVEFETNPEPTLLYYGQEIDGVSLLAKITPRSNKIQSLEFLLNGNVINHIDNPHSSSIGYNYQNPITNTSVFVVAVNDGKEVITREKSFNYTAPVMYGSVQNPDPSSEEILSLTKEAHDVGTLDLEIEAEESYPCVAIPDNFKNLKDIKDENGFVITNSFNVKQMEIEVGGVICSYNVYTFKTITTVINYNFIFEY